MNLKGFKKVQEDEQKAILKNQHGHSITIAKKALPKQHLEALKRLPLHAAEGTVAPKSFAASIQENYPAQQQPLTAEGPNESSDSREATPADLGLQPIQPQQNRTPSQDNNSQNVTPSDTTDSGTADEATDAAMQGNTTTGPGGIPLASAQNQNAGQYETQAKQQELNQQAALWDQDLNNGHVTPETYSNLLGKKDTLGKIGTLFGLLVSGAGAGLTHQPNAVMEMMNKEIDRDLEAQKQSKANAQNILKIYQNGALNDATIKRYAAENGLTYANARNVLAEGAFNEAKNRWLGIVPHYIGAQINKMPNSPQKQQALGAHAMLQQGAAAEINQNNQRTAQMEYDAKSDANIDYNRMNQLALGSRLGLPTASEADIGNMTKEAAGLEEARALRSDFNNGYMALDKMYLAGKLNPHQRDSYVQSLAGKLAKASAGRYNQEEATNQINSMVPQVGDWGETRDIRKSNNDHFFDILEAGTPTLNRYHLKKAPQELSRQSQSKYYEGQTASDGKGKTLTFRNGGWK